MLDYKNLPENREISIFKFVGETFNGNDLYSTENWEIGPLQMPISENGL